MVNLSSLKVFLFEKTSYSLLNSWVTDTDGVQQYSSQPERMLEHVFGFVKGKMAEWDRTKIGFLGFVGGTCPWPESLVSFKITTAATTEQKEDNLFSGIVL